MQQKYKFVRVIQSLCLFTHVATEQTLFSCLLRATVVHVMKVRGDGSFRPLNDLRLNEDILERKYYDVEMNEACTCDVISIGKPFPQHLSFCQSYVSLHSQLAEEWPSSVITGGLKNCFGGDW